MNAPRMLTNLLPPERQARLRREYFFRLGALAVGALALLTMLHGAMLVPSYAYLREQLSVRESYAAQLAAALEASEERSVDARISALKDDASYLLALADAPSTSAALRAVLMVPRPGVSLSGFSYTPPAGTAGTMTVRGVAASREALRSYHAALSALPGVETAELPIAAYAEETDIGFIVTLTGSFAHSETP
jgi:hypothetical protein